VPAIDVIVYVAVPGKKVELVSVCAMLLPAPSKAPVTPFDIAVHANAVPVTFDVNVMPVVLPLHIACEDGVAITSGSGFTVITTSVGVPEQPLAVGVIVYVAVPADVPEFVSVCAMLLPEPSEAPATPLCATVHAKVVPVTFDNVMSVAVLLHIVCDEGVAVTDIYIGLTVITTLVDVPEQPLAVGVIEYVAVPAVVPEFVSVCAMLLPDPSEAPATPLCATVHAKVVPKTFDVNVMPVAVLLHIVCDEGVAVTSGIGFTVITTSVDVPEQPLAVGVIEYVAVPAVVPEFVSACAMLLPEPSVAPVTSLCATVHAKVVPVTSDVKAMSVVAPLHIVCNDGVAVISGSGFTVNVAASLIAASVYVPLTTQ